MGKKWLKGKQIQEVAKIAAEVLTDAGKSLRDNELTDEIYRRHPELSDYSLWRGISSARNDGHIKRVPGKGYTIGSASGGVETSHKTPAAETHSGMSSRSPGEDYKREKDLYPAIKEVLEKDWAQAQGLKANTLVEVTAHQRAKGTRGRWTRPDLTVVAVHVYPLLPTKYLEVITFEVKPAHRYDIAAVFEAAAHQRAATRSFLAIHTPNGTPKLDDSDFKRLVDECKRLGIGLTTFVNPKDYATYAVHVEADRRVPDPYALNQFLDQLPTRAKDEIRGWLK